ncbi:MAG: SGNH/GDSL hydrolase family protein [Clostridia bacterium]|nr:SGNH/GDSL hydrolase family protein [Clostridia bacterium]
MKICIFGDSIGKGVVYDGGLERYLPSEKGFAKLWAQDADCEIENFSRYGCTVTRGVELMEKNAEKIEDADYVLLEFGGNDSDFDWQKVAEDPKASHAPKTPLEIFTETYKRAIEGVRKLGKIPVLMNLPPIDEIKYFSWISRGLSKENILKWLGGSADYIYRWHEMYNAAVCAVSHATGALLIDIRSAFLVRKDYSEYLCEDGIHPNEKGHGLIREVLERVAFWRGAEVPRLCEAGSL